MLGFYDLKKQQMVKRQNSIDFISIDSTQLTKCWI